MKLKHFILSLLPQLQEAGRYRKIAAYRSTLTSLSRFYKDQIEPELKDFYQRKNIEAYLTYLRSTGVTCNTQSFYINNLRSAYAAAVEQHLLKHDFNIFTRLRIGYVTTEKRALSPDTLAMVALADLSHKPFLENSRDYFVLSLFLQGMTFMDMAYLRPGDFRDGKIRYRRRKTNSYVEVTVIPPAVNTLYRLMSKAKASPYLLPILHTHDDLRSYTSYQSALHRQNRHLKEISIMLGLRETLTTYSTRHSWATTAYMNGIDLGVVSQGMGHRTEDITRTYLAAFADNRMQEANLVVWLTVLNKLVNMKPDRESSDTLQEAKVQINQITKYLERIEANKELNGLGKVIKSMQERSKHLK